MGKALDVTKVISQANRVSTIQLDSEAVICEAIENAMKTCSNCAASCCRFEVFLISDTGVPEQFIQTHDDGMQTMKRSSDGWCSALNRDSMQCSIYSNRPWLCREFDMGSEDCLDVWSPL